MSKIIRLTETQLKNIVSRVISEQTAPMGFVDPFSSAQKQQAIKDKQRIDNIANVIPFVKDGVITAPNSKLNNTKWIDYVTRYQVTPEDIKAANSTLAQRKTTQDTQNQRYVNIANVMKSVDPTTTVIKSTNPKLNGMSWVNYIKTYKVSQDDINKAQSYVASLSKQDPKGAANAAAAVKTASAATGKSDPKVLELQKSLGFKGKDLDGIMGPKTKAALASKNGGTPTQMKYDASGKPVTPGTRGGQMELGDTSKGNYEQYAWDNRSGSWILAQDWRKKNGTVSTVSAEKTQIKPATFDTSKLSKIPTIQMPQSNVSAERRQEIASKVDKQRLTGNLIYKGEDLNPEEKAFLNDYIKAKGGGELDKDKDKGYGQKMVYSN